MKFVSKRFGVSKLIVFMLAVVIGFFAVAPNAAMASVTPSSPLVKGEIVTVDNLSYKVLSVTSKKTLQFVGVKNPTSTVTIPATVRISGATYKVISIAKNAMRQDTDLTSVTIGKNVSKIGKNAFRSCSNLSKIVIKTTKLNIDRIGTGVFKGVKNNAKFYVPKAKMYSYRNLFGGVGTQLRFYYA